MTAHQKFFIGGQWREAKSQARIDVVSPATEDVIGSVPDATAEDVDAAVLAARTAFDDGPWPGMSVAERADILDSALDILDGRAAAISTLVTAEMGLPTAIATGLVPAGVGTGRYFTKLARAGIVSEVRRTSFGDTAVVKEPVGVVASIAPWNGPFNMALGKVIPALVAGCTVVFKPAPETPLDAFVIAEALAEAGLPAGAFNLITGDRDAGRALVAHPGIDKVSFTGSTSAGREIGRECGGSFKRVQLELGGKSAAIILDDADVATTMTGLAMGCFFNTGQVCAAYSRVLVPNSRRDEMVAALVATAQSFTIGDPTDPTTTMGPLVSKQQHDRVLGYIETGKAEGAVVATGGRVPPGLDTGYFVEPTVFVEAANSMRICQEEIFGPVVAVIGYDTVDEAVAIANDSDYGLHGAVFTGDPARAADVARRIRTGTFSVNTFVYNTEAPFGGIKCSGIGRDTGPEALQAYYELKTINLSEGMQPLFA